MKPRDIDRYDLTKTKLILSVTCQAKNRLYTISRMYGTDMGFLIEILINELYYDPLSPTLPKRVEESAQKTNAFFRKQTGWQEKINLTNRDL